MEVIKWNTKVAMETMGEAQNSKTKSKMAEIEGWRMVPRKSWISVTFHRISKSRKLL